MATYFENTINYNSDSEIEYSLSLWNTPKIKVFIGLSQKINHIGRWTFLDENKNDTIFGNGCRFRTIDQAIEYIKNDIKSEINNNKIPSNLIINGIVTNVFTKVSENSIFV